MRLKTLEISGFKSFAKKSMLDFDSPISAIVGPNGSGKSNIAESFRFVLGEQSIKSMRGKRGEDLIFNGTQSASKQNRASVKVVFDNNDRTLPLDFDEVSIERVVNRDGANEYFINNSGVRLKDVVELLASANIGSSGHHIISQGETDRILNTTPKERRAMFEDALGLRIFQYKKVESQKKLQKTQENIEQVQSLRKEIIPHIRFLKKQVEKIEKTKELIESLKVFYKEYLKREEVYIKYYTRDITSQLEVPQQNLVAFNQKLEKVKKQFEQTNNTVQSDLDRELSEVNVKISDFNRQLGQMEGEKNSLIRMRNSYSYKSVAVQTISVEKIESLKFDLENLIIEAESSEDTGFIKSIISKIRNVFSKFIQDTTDREEDAEKNNFDEQIAEIENRFTQTEKEVKELESLKVNLINKIREESEKSKGGEREIYELMTQKNDLETKINHLRSEREKLIRDEEEFKRELGEGAILVGRDVTNYDDIILNENEFLSENRSIQQERRRELEKMKIRVEEFAGGNSEEILREYAEVNERDEFLMKEIEDLEKSSESLKSLILELEEKIDAQFKQGIQKINGEFQRLFEIMFGGGEAALKLVRPQTGKRQEEIELGENDDGEEMVEEKETEEGIDIDISLPRKKIKGLMMLSGGERALTSIALLFAMSAVNPPPFIILDETDAALDEANSRKYGDMVAHLAEHSQLIVITHNRETMSRAGVLYGVTMMQGISQLLSIKFEDGERYAK